MKKIMWVFFDKKIIFNLNLLEYIIFKRFFKKRNYEIIKNNLRGEKLDVVIVDEKEFYDESVTKELL